MKTNLLIVSLVILTGAVYAQGTLQFNQVLLINSATPQQVPNGKVWKVESALFSNETYVIYSSSQGGSCSCGQGNAAYLYAYASIAALATGNLTINGTTYNYTSGGTMWLPAGTSLASVTISTPPQQSTPATGCYDNYYISGVYQGCGPYTPPTATITSIVSVIEFNIVP